MGCHVRPVLQPQGPACVFALILHMRSGFMCGAVRRSYRRAPPQLSWRSSRSGCRQPRAYKRPHCPQAIAAAGRCVPVLPCTLAELTRVDFPLSTILHAVQDTEDAGDAGVYISSKNGSIASSDGGPGSGKAEALRSLRERAVFVCDHLLPALNLTYFLSISCLQYEFQRAETLSSVAASEAEASSLSAEAAALEEVRSFAFRVC